MEELTSTYKDKNLIKTRSDELLYEFIAKFSFDLMINQQLMLQEQKKKAVKHNLLTNQGTKIGHP
jgi:argonaute-like protein implicated in RNA metabolism and viral defense